MINQLFLYESLFPYILAICTWIFRPKFKTLDFGVIAGYLEKRISVHTVLRQLYIENQKHVPNFWIYDAFLLDKQLLIWRIVQIVCPFL